MTATYTHIFREAGNGFPQDGDHVLCVYDGGQMQVLVLDGTSPIHTAQWQANYVYCQCSRADLQVEDFSDPELDGMYSVEPIDE